MCTICSEDTVNVLSENNEQMASVSVCAGKEHSEAISDQAKDDRKAPDSV